MKNLSNTFLKFFRESIRDLIPIVAVILFFQMVILQQIPDNWQSTAIWLGIVAIWLTIFLMWLQYGIFPIWERLSTHLTKNKSYFWILLFAFLIWFSTTIAEPALLLIAEKAAIISEWKVDPDILRYIVALSVWVAISLWSYRILKWIPIHIPIIIWYILVVWITYITPKEMVGLAYDLWWVTTSTITVPLVTAIWIWIAAMAKKKNPVINWFWLIACASLLPMFFVQVYWIYVYNFSDTLAATISTPIKETVETFTLTLDTIITWLFSTIIDVLPIILTILFFQYIILREKIPTPELKNIVWWFAMVIIGLYFFILGLDMWLFNLGSEMANQLTQLNQELIIYLFAFFIGFSTTMAEPTLIAISNKASEISHWKINAFILRIFVALWVWIWITLWTYRIIVWDFIHYYIMIWYIFVVILTYFAPKHITAIAYDSGWVTTSTITVPLVAALWIWLATNIPGRDPLFDGFWLIAFASLFPIISVLWYGIITKYYKIQPRGQFKKELEHDLPHVK